MNVITLDTGIEKIYIVQKMGNKLFFSKTKSTNFDSYVKPVKYDAKSNKILTGVYNFDLNDDLIKKMKPLGIENTLQVVQRSTITAVAGKTRFEQVNEYKTKFENVKNPINTVNDDNVVYPVYHWGFGKGSDNPMLLYKENGETFLRRLKKDYKNFKGDERFYKYDDNKKRTYVVKYKDGEAYSPSLRIDDHKPLGNKNNLNTPSAYRNIEYQFGGGETDLRFKTKSQNPKIIDLGTRNIETQDHTTYTGTQGISFVDDKKNNVNYVAGMTQEERKLTDLPYSDSLDNRIVKFPKSRSYDYLVLNSGGEPRNFEFIVRKGDKLYLTNSLPRDSNSIDTSRPIVYNKATDDFSIQDYSGVASRQLSKNKIRFLSGMGKNSITGKTADRNSINDGLENFAQRKLQQEPEPKPEPKVPDLAQQFVNAFKKEKAEKEPDSKDDEPAIVDEMIKKDMPQEPDANVITQKAVPILKPNDVPNENLEDIPPETKGDAVGQVSDAGGVNQITQQDEGVQLISEDEVNLNVVSNINPYEIETVEKVPVNITKPDGTPLSFDLLDKMKTSYNVDRFDANNQSKSFIEYYNNIKSEHPRKLEYFLDEPNVNLSSFFTFVSNLEDTMDVREEDLFQFYGNDLYKGATRSVPLILNPNLTEQPDADYNILNRYTEDSFGAVVLAGLMFRALKKEKVVLKNADGDGIIETTYLDHTDNALKSRLGKNFFTASKMDITQLKFYVCISLASIYSTRQKKMPRHRLNNTIVRIINSIPYVKFNLVKKDVEDMVKDFRQMFINHPMPFNFGPLSEFYEKVSKYVFQINPNFNFEYLFNHISADLQKLIPAIEKAFRTRQDFKSFLIRLYQNHQTVKETFNDYNEFIKGNRKLTAEDFTNKFTNGEEIFGSTSDDKGEEYFLFNEETDELIERVFIPFDENKKAITLFINEEGKYYESREENRTDFFVNKADENLEGTETFKTDTLTEKDLPDNLMDSLKQYGNPYLQAILTGAVGHQMGKLFEENDRDAELEASLSRVNMISSLKKLDLLGYDHTQLIDSETADIVKGNIEISSNQFGYDPSLLMGRLPTDDTSVFHTPNLNKALLSKKIQDMIVPDSFMGKFYRNIPSFQTISKLAGNVPLINLPVQQAGAPTRPVLMRQSSNPLEVPEQIDPRDSRFENFDLVGVKSLQGKNWIAEQVNGKYIVRVHSKGMLNIFPNSFKIFDNVFYKITFGNLDNQMWVGINPGFLVPLRPILAVGAGVLISKYLLKKRTPLQRIRDKNIRGDKVLDLSIGRPLEISSRVGLGKIINNADKVYFHSFELKKYEHYFYKYNLRGNTGRAPTTINLKDDWHDNYIKEIIDPFFEKYGKYMNQEEKFMEVARFVISAQAFDQGFDQRLYTPDTTDLFIDNLRKSLTPRAFDSIIKPQGYLEKDFWIVFESLTFRFRKLIFEQHNLNYENLENGTKMLETDNFVSTLNRLDFIADDLPEIKLEKINMEHIDDKADSIENKNLIPRKSDLRYLNLSKLAYQVNQIGYDILTLFPKPILEQDKISPNLREAYKLRQISEADLIKFNIKNDKLIKSFGLYDAKYYTDDLRDFILIINEFKTKALIGVAGSKMSFSLSTLRDWGLTNLMNIDTGAGLISQFRARAKVIFDTVKDIITDNTEIYISGHSMGASVANNLAFQLNKYKYNLKLHLIGFATPAFLTTEEIKKFTDSMKKVLYKNYYIYNDIVGKIGVNLFPPEKNNIILYEDGWKDVELKSRYFNSLRKAKDTYTKNTHAIILYGKYLRIAVNSGELKDDKVETKDDELYNFDVDNFIKMNPDIDNNLIMNLMNGNSHKVIRLEMERTGLSLNDTIRKMLRERVVLQQEKQLINRKKVVPKTRMTDFSKQAPMPETNSNWLNYVKNLDITKFFSNTKDNKDEL